jgi:hypothetical protein
MPALACANHPAVEAMGHCGRCGRPICAGCTVELLGQRLCAPCRDWRVAELQGYTARVFGPGRRHAQSLRALAIFLPAFFAPLLIGLALVSWAPIRQTGLLAACIALGSLGASIGLSAFLAPRLALPGNDRLREDVRRKLLATGVPDSALGGPFVGVSPGEERCSFDGDSNWDVGFLSLEPGWLAYYGDQVRFALRPHQLESVAVDPRAGVDRLSRFACSSAGATRQLTWADPWR